MTTCEERIEIPSKIDIVEYDNEYLNMLEEECERRMVVNGAHFVRCKGISYE